VRVYSTFNPKDPQRSVDYKKKILNTSAVFYDDAYSVKKLIIKENKGKAGIYM
jgi:hypothetical protein